MSRPRTITRPVELALTHPGGGFDSARSLNPRSLGADISPFVDLTEFHMSQPVFRPHPHAGFSAVTYMFEDSPGSFRNRWSKGDSDLIPPGSIHWTQAGAGMMHEEIPTEPGVTCHGLQMFVKLSADDELTPPEAFHLDPDEVVELAPGPGVRIRLLAGTLGDTDAGIAIRNSLTFAEVHLAEGATIDLPAPTSHNAFVFVQAGSLVVGDTTVAAGHAAAFAPDGDTVTLSSAGGTSFLFGAGAGLGEPLHARGSFMMSTVERLAGAERAFRNGEMGSLESSF